MNYSSVSRALSINHKRADINVDDVLFIADAYTIKNPKKIIREVQETIAQWEHIAQELEIPKKVIKAIQTEFVSLL